MNVCLVSAAEVDGGLPEQLAALAQAGVTLTVAMPEQGGDDRAGDIRRTTVAALADERCDVAIARDWRATLWLFEVPADRYALIVDDLGHTDVHAGDTDRVLATVAINLPVDLVATTRPVADELRAMRPEARVLLVDPAAGAQAWSDALAAISAEPPPAQALLPRRLMADLDAALIAFHLEYLHAITSYERLQEDELVRLSTAIRSAYRSQRLAPLRRTASPLVVRAKRRFAAGDGDDPQA